MARLFRSRWAALFWSAGILWTAYDVADDAPEAPAAPVSARGNAAGPVVTQDAAGSTFDTRDLAVLANAED